MPLLTTISGIRGTIGGSGEDCLNPQNTVRFVAAFSTLLQSEFPDKPLRVVVGRDGRISGPILQDLVVATLRSMGISVIDLGLSTTPSVEMAVSHHNAQGGIILTASHNPREWNALKLLNSKGEFISSDSGKKLLEIAASGTFNFAGVLNLGGISYDNESIQRHITAIINHPLVNRKAIAAAGFRIGLDAINSTGAIAVPALLEALGLQLAEGINMEVHGNFAHNPEPLPAHLVDLCKLVNEHDLDLGISVDPDVDRLAFVSEDGSLFGEEYTLVAVADYVLSKSKGNTVSNLSSTRALRDVTLAHGGSYSASAVGEVHVVSRMKETNAIIGGEGNGGVILPDLHYGRDALAGIALFLSLLAESGLKLTELRAKYPRYEMVKEKIDLSPGMELAGLLDTIKSAFAGAAIDETDGVKIDLPEGWVHLRPSNTEPIVRVYAESAGIQEAKSLAERVMAMVNNYAL